MPETTKEFKNENVEGVVTRSPRCKIKLDITVSQKGIDTAYNEAMKAINKEVSIPGFRKGKAPEAMIIKQFQKHIQSEWENRVINFGFREALSLIESTPLSEKTIKKPAVKELDRNKGVTFSIEYEEQFKLPDLKTSDFTVQRVEPQPVSEEKINEMIEKLRLQFADWNVVEDRALNEGDFADLTVYLLEQGPSKDQEVQIYEKNLVQLKDTSVPKWMIRVLKGKKMGESVEAVSEDERDCTSCASGEAHEHQPFEATKCRILIETVKEPVPADDAKLLEKTTAPSIEELRERAKKQLSADFFNNARQQEREQILKQLENNYSFEIPASISDRDRAEAGRKKTAELRKLNLSTEEFEKRAQEELQKVNANVDTSLRSFLLTRLVADKFSVQVSNEELTRQLFYEMYTNPEMQNLSEEERENVQQNIYSRMLYEKSLDYLIDHAKVNS